MRGQLLKLLFSVVITLFFVGSLLTTLVWYMVDNNNVEPQRPPPQKKSAPHPSDPCNGCREVIGKVLERFSKPWKKQEDNYQKFRSQLSSKCHGSAKGIITQTNTPVGSKLVYDGEKKRTLQVTPEIFSTFAKRRLRQRGSAARNSSPSTRSQSEQGDTGTRSVTRR